MRLFVSTEQLSTAFRLFLSFLLFFTGAELLAQTPRTLVFDATKFAPQSQDINGRTVAVRAYEKIIYVANPVDTTYEIMNIYIPEAYFNEGTINGYTAKTAPIFFPNKVGGYMPAQPATFLSQTQRGGDAWGKSKCLRCHRALERIYRCFGRGTGPNYGQRPKRVYGQSPLRTC